MKHKGICIRIGSHFQDILILKIWKIGVERPLFPRISDKGDPTYDYIAIL